MGSWEYFKTRRKKLPGKTLSPRLVRLEENFKKNGGEHVEKKIGEIFEKKELKFLKDTFDKSKDVSRIQTEEFNLPLVNAKDGDNGIMYYGRESDFESVDMSIDIVNDGAVSTGNVYAQPQKTGVLYNAYLIKFKDEKKIKDQITRRVLLYCSKALEKSIKLKFGYENKASWNKVKEEFVKLPFLNGKIYFSYMEKYIEELEAERIEELEAYLIASGLKDYTLKESDLKTLDRFNDMNDNLDRQTDRQR